MEDDTGSIDLDEVELVESVHNSRQIRLKDSFKFGVSNVSSCDQE